VAKVATVEEKPRRVFICHNLTTKVTTSCSFPRVCIAISNLQRPLGLLKLKASGFPYVKRKSRPGMLEAKHLLEQCHLMEWKRKQVRTIAWKFTLNFQLLHPIQPPMAMAPQQDP